MGILYVCRTFLGPVGNSGLGPGFLLIFEDGIITLSDRGELAICSAREREIAVVYQDSQFLAGRAWAAPAVFPGDFVNRSSLTMVLHTIAAIGSFLAFLITGFATPALLRRFPGWRAYAWPSLVLVILSIASGFLRSGSMPGIGQRITFVFAFCWIFLLGLGLFRRSALENPRHRNTFSRCQNTRSKP